MTPFLSRIFDSQLEIKFDGHRIISLPTPLALALICFLVFAILGFIFGLLYPFNGPVARGT